MTKSWDRRDGDRHDDFVVHEIEFLLDHDSGTGQNDVAGACTCEEFLGGWFDPEVREIYGEDVLAEVRNVFHELVCKEMRTRPSIPA
jgi:hypothetical protein